MDTTPQLQVWRQSFTSLHGRGSWITLRPASGREQAVAASSPHGQFWLGTGNVAYYREVALSMADRRARIITPAAS